MSIKSRITPDTGAYDGPHAITPHIWWVGRSAWGGIPELTHPTDCNIFLLKGDKFDVLIDCGGNASISKLEKNIRLAGSKPSRIREIWLTHSHGDHFLGAGVWAKRYPETICRISKISIDHFRRKNYQFIGNFHPVCPAHFHVPRKFLPLKEGSVLKCAPFEFMVEETPGHVPDCLVFRGNVDGLKVLFSGDTIIGDQDFVGHGHLQGLVGWIDGYWLSNIRHFQKSVTKLATKPTDLILPGHGKSHAGKAAARTMKNCVRRLDRLVASPDVFNMGPYFSFGS